MSPAVERAIRSEAAEVANELMRFVDSTPQERDDHQVICALVSFAEAIIALGGR